MNPLRRLKILLNLSQIFRNHLKENMMYIISFNFRGRKNGIFIRCVKDCLFTQVVPENIKQANSVPVRYSPGEPI